MGLDVSGVIIDRSYDDPSEFGQLLNLKLSFIEEVTLDECLENFKDENVCDVYIKDGKTLVMLPLDYGSRTVKIPNQKVCSFVYSELGKIYGASYTDNEEVVYSFLSENKKFKHLSGDFDGIRDLKAKDQVKRMIEIVAGRQIFDLSEDVKGLCRRYRILNVEEAMSDDESSNDIENQRIETAAKRLDDDSESENEALPLSTLIMLVCFFIPFVGPIYYVIFDKERHHNSVVALWISLAGLIAYILLGMIIF